VGNKTDLDNQYVTLVSLKYNERQAQWPSTQIVCIMFNWFSLKSFMNTRDRTDNFYCWFFVVLFWCWGEQQEGIPNIRENKKHRFYSRHFFNKTLETLQLAKSYHHYWWLYFYWSWLEPFDPRNKTGKLYSCSNFFCHYNIFYCYPTYVNKWPRYKTKFTFSQNLTIIVFQNIFSIMKKVWPVRCLKT